MTKHVTIAANTIKGFGLVATLLVASSSHASDPGIVPVYGSVNGNIPMTYSQWVARWRQWEFSIPADISPVLDTTGEFADEGQVGSVWFLAETSGFGETVTRTVTIPSGKWLFVPIVGVYWENYESLGDDPWSPEQRAFARRSWILPVLDAVDELSCEIDGVSVDLENYRVLTPDGEEYMLTEPENNIFGEDAFTYGPVLDGGYFVMLRPLSAGDHTIHFVANIDFRGETFHQDVTYNLTVEDDHGHH